jgi:hypothetical protein
MAAHRIVLTNQQIASYVLLTLGLVSLLASLFFNLETLALIGLGLTFWGAFFVYVTPTKYVKLDFLIASATASLSNIERILTSEKTDSKGVYLPPKYLKDYQSSLVFIPPVSDSSLPKFERALLDSGTLYSKDPTGILLTPPGSDLCKLFEKELKKFFTDTDFHEVQEDLPRLLEKLRIAKSTTIQQTANIVTVEVKHHIFEDLCKEAIKLRRTHESIGCLLPSTIACVLAKATGKPVIIEKEEQSPDNEGTKITFRIGED